VLHNHTRQIFPNAQQQHEQVSSLVFLAFASVKRSQGLFRGSTGFGGVATLPVLMGKEELLAVIERSAKEGPNKMVTVLSKNTKEGPNQQLVRTCVNVEVRQSLVCILFAHFHPCCCCCCAQEQARRLQTSGTDICICQPSTFTFKLDFSNACLGSDFLVSGSAATARGGCDGDGVSVVESFLQVKVTEFGQNGALVGRTTFDGLFADQDEFRCKSTAETDPGTINMQFGHCWWCTRTTNCTVLGDCAQQQL